MKSFGLLSIIGCCLSSMACEESVAWSESTTQAGQIVRQTHYMKDPRTGICFVYRWGISAFDGPSLALAAVSCEMVPQQLLEEVR